MAFAYTTEGGEISVRRDSKNVIKISTVTPITDEQMGELAWIVVAMVKSGKTLKDLTLPKHGDE